MRNESKTTRFYFLLPHADGGRLLLCREDEAITLPSVEMPHDADLLDVGRFNEAAKAQLGLNVTTLYSRHCYNKPEPPIVVFNLENHDPAWTPAIGTHWEGEAIVEVGHFTSDLQRAIVKTWFAERSVPEAAMLPWWRSGWIAEAHAWIAARLDDLGLSLAAPIEQRKSWYLSAVMRVPTTTGDLYFKAATPYTAREVVLASVLPDWDSEHAPEVVATESDRLWMLSRDMNGASLEQERTLEAWGAALQDYARFQQRTTDRLPDLMQMGCPDLRLPCLSAHAEWLFPALPALLEGLPEHLNPIECTAMITALPQFRDLCARADAFGVPATLVHGDFHGINVVRSANRTLFFDWSDGCVSHPFFDAMELLASDDWMPPEEDAYNRLRDLYLRQWTAYASVERLRELWTLLEPLRSLSMAFANARILEGMEALCPLAMRLPHSYARWSTQQQQYSLAMHLRDLLK